MGSGCVRGHRRRRRGSVGLASPNVTIKSNNVSNTQFGIAIVSDPTLGVADGAILTSNTVSLTHLYDGIDLCSNNNKATGNTISGSDESGIHLDDTCPGAGTGNTVTSNKERRETRLLPTLFTTSSPCRRRAATPVRLRRVWPAKLWPGRMRESGQRDHREHRRKETSGTCRGHSVFAPGIFLFLGPYRPRSYAMSDNRYYVKWLKKGYYFPRRPVATT